MFLVSCQKGETGHEDGPRPFSPSPVLISISNRERQPRTLESFSRGHPLVITGKSSLDF